MVQARTTMRKALSIALEPANTGVCYASDDPIAFLSSGSEDSCDFLFGLVVSALMNASVGRKRIRLPEVPRQYRGLLTAILDCLEDLDLIDVARDGQSGRLSFRVTEVVRKLAEPLAKDVHTAIERAQRFVKTKSPKNTGGSFVCVECDDLEEFALKRNAPGLTVTSAEKLGWYWTSGEGWRCPACAEEEGA